MQLLLEIFGRALLPLVTPFDQDDTDQELEEIKTELAVLRNLAAAEAVV